MKKGITPESKELRRHLLSHNGPDVVERMQQSGMADAILKPARWVAGSCVSEKSFDIKKISRELKKAPRR